MSERKLNISKSALVGMYWGEPPMSAHQIAKELGVNHTSVIYKLRKYGISVRPVHSGKVAPIPLDLEKAKQMYVEQGMVLKEISAALNVPWEIVRKHLRRAGVTMKPRHARVRTTCKEIGCSE